MYAINRLSDISCFNVIDSLSIVLASLIMALRYGFLFAVIATTAFWMFICRIIKNYYWKSSRFKEIKSIFAKVLSQLYYRAI
jgi:ABC-type transport system involved in Fe-S cluster assembly fused permease/ATPase subunit